MEENKRYVEYDARQEFSKDTNNRFTICCYYHETRQYDKLFRAANTLYISVFPYFTKEETKHFSNMKDKYYYFYQDLAKIKRLGQNNTKQGYIYIYLPAKIQALKMADEFFMSLSAAIHNNGLLLPTGNSSEADFDINKVFADGAI